MTDVSEGIDNDEIESSTRNGHMNHRYAGISYIKKYVTILHRFWRKHKLAAAEGVPNVNFDRVNFIIVLRHVSPHSNILRRIYGHLHNLRIIIIDFWDR